MIGQNVADDLAPIAGSLMAPEDALDRGARGLEYFEQFLPAARRLGIEDREFLDLCAKYDVERGLDLHALESDVDVVETAAAAARSAAEEHGVAVNALSSAWWDGAGADAAAFAAAVRDRAMGTAEQLTFTAQALAELPNTLRQAVQTKAFEVASLYETTVAGYTARQIDVLVEIGELTAESAPYQVERLVADAARWCPDIATAAANASSDSSDLSGTVAGAGRGRLRDSFVPCYTRVRDMFDEACTRCTDTVATAYRAVSQEAEKISVDPYPVPGEFASIPGSPAAVPSASSSGAPAQLVDPPNAPSESPRATAPAAVAGPPAQGDSRSTEVGTEPSQARQPSQVPQPSYYDTVPGSVRYGGGYSDLSGIGPLPENGGLSGLLNGGTPGSGLLGDLGSVGSGLSGLIGDVRSLVEPVIDDVVSALATHGEEGKLQDDAEPDDGVAAEDGPAEHPEEAAEPPEDVKSLELKADGHTWTLAIDEGKGISLAIDDGNGEATKYGIELGPDGIPRIVVEDESDCAGEKSGDTETAQMGDEAGQTGVAERKVVEESVDDPVPEPPGVAQEAGVTEPPVTDMQAAEPPLADMHVSDPPEPVPVLESEPELATVSPEPEPEPEPGTGTESEADQARLPGQSAGSSEAAGLGTGGAGDADSGVELAEAGPL